MDHCLLPIMLSTVVRQPLVDWRAFPPSAASPPLPNLTESCGCWVSDDRRWVDMDAGAPIPMAGVEATLRRPFRANFSLDGLSWWGAADDNGTLTICQSSPCLLRRPVLARWARIVPVWFDAYADTPLAIQGAILTCRYRLAAQGLSGNGTFGDTGALVFVREWAPGNPSPLSPPNLTATAAGNDTAPSLSVYSTPLLGGGEATANVSHAALWAGNVLELYGMAARLADGLHRRRAALNASSTAQPPTSASRGGGRVWLAVLHAPGRGPIQVELQAARPPAPPP